MCSSLESADFEFRRLLVHLRTNSCDSKFIAHSVRLLSDKRALSLPTIYVAYVCGRISELCSPFRAYCLREGPADGTVNNSTFCPSLLMCFVFISEKTATCVIYVIN
jgi:hypothetical protein